MNDGERTVIEVAHQDHGVAQIFGEQNGVAQHAVSLEAPLAQGQSQMAVEDVKHGVRFHLEIRPEAIAGLAPGGLIGEVVLLLVKDR